MTTGAAGAASTGKVRLRVLAKTMVAREVCELLLGDVDGRRLPDWAPGAHIDLTLANGATRQYSLCGDRWDPYQYRVAALREPRSRGGSTYIHDVLAEGDVVEVAGPRNNFFLVPAESYLFVAGGIGITPLLPMIIQADLLDIPWRLVYGGRTRPSMAYLADLGAWADRVTVHPQDEAGLLPFASLLAAEPGSTKVYACGPEPMLQALAAAHRGRINQNLRVERFVPQDRGAPVRSSSFVVELARSGTEMVVGPDTSILDAVAAAGVPILASCRQGVCGTCETTVLAGVPDHRDSILDDVERARGSSFYPCVSRAASDRIVIDA